MTDIDAQPPGSFGPTRGSGLVRGKRATTPAASAASAPQADYKPTALEVIIPQREYKNPFGSEEPSAEPSAVASAKADAAAPAKSVPVADVPELEAPTYTATPAPAPARAPAATREEERPSLNILPPAEARRPSVSWERPASSPAQAPYQQQRPRREDFRRERRDDRPAGRPDQRQPSDPRDQHPREQCPRRDFNEARREQDAPRKPGGFFGWLKRLFGGKTEAVPAQDQASSRDEQRPYPHRRRRRGGRGRNFGERGGQPSNPQGSGTAGQSQFQGGEGQGQSHGGHRRRRGGRGRYRGERDPRPEGQQGGGAI